MGIFERLKATDYRFVGNGVRKETIMILNILCLFSCSYKTHSHLNLIITQLSNKKSTVLFFNTTVL
jgi:hypothetical protein